MAESVEKDTEIHLNKNPNKLQLLKDRLAGIQFLKSTVAKGIATTLLTIALLLFLAPFFLNNSALKFQIEQKVSQALGASFTINGEVSVFLLPTPTIVAENVLLQNYGHDNKVYNLHARSIEIKLSIFKFLYNGSSIRKIDFFDALLETYSSANPPTNHKNKFTEIAAEIIKNHSDQTLKNNNSLDISSKIFGLLNFQASKIDPFTIPEITLENGEIISYDKFAREKNIKEINAELKFNNNKISTTGSFNNDNIVNVFEMETRFNSNSKQRSFLKLNSSILNAKITGNFPSKNNGILISDFEGKIEAEIFDLKSFYRNYLGGNSVIYEKLKAGTKSIKLSADVKNSAGEIAINNLVLNSPLIDGKGEIMLDFTSKIPIIDIVLNIENIDLDNIWSSDNFAAKSTDENSQNTINSNDETTEALPNLSSNLPIENNQTSQEAVTKDQKPEQKSRAINLEITNNIKNFDLTSEVTIKNIKYLGGEIKDVDLYLTVSKEGKILILPMIFKIPGEGILRVNGVLENGDLPRFVGKFDASGKKLQEIFKWLKIESQNLKFESLKEYSIYSDVLLLPSSSSLNNFYLNLHNGESEFLGEIKIDNSEKTANVTSRFQVSNFNIDDYFLISGQNAYLSSGILLKKLLWLNDIAAKNDLDLTFDSLTYKGETFASQKLKLKFGQGYFQITDLNLKSDKTDLKLNLSVDISGKDPRFNMNLAANNFHYESPQNKSDDNKKTQNINAADQFFSLPSLEGFSGNIALGLNNVKFDNLEINNAKFTGILQDGNIDVSQMDCDIYNGTLKYKGLLVMKINKTLNGNLSLKNISLKEFLSDTVGINKISGISNITASITSSASAKEEFIKELSSEIKFMANSPTIEGYGLSDLIKKMFSLQTYRQELNEPEKILFNPESKTVFKQASGDILIGKGKENKIKINFSAPALNGVISGQSDLSENTIDGLVNIIFLTGSRQKQTPINIATVLRGNMRNISQSSNLDQVKQYLGLIKAKPQEIKQEIKAVAAKPNENNNQNQPSEFIAPEQNNSNSINTQNPQSNGQIYQKSILIDPSNNKPEIQNQVLRQPLNQTNLQAQ